MCQYNVNTPKSSLEGLVYDGRKACLLELPALLPCQLLWEGVVFLWFAIFVELEEAHLRPNCARLLGHTHDGPLAIDQDPLTHGRLEIVAATQDGQKFDWFCCPWEAALIVCLLGHQVDTEKGASQ